MELRSTSREAPEIKGSDAVPFDGLTTAEYEDAIERAAILEYDAGYPRAEAERLARQMVIQARKVKGDYEPGLATN